MIFLKFHHEHIFQFVVQKLRDLTVRLKALFRIFFDRLNWNLILILYMVKGDLNLLFKKTNPFLFLSYGTITISFDAVFWDHSLQEYFCRWIWESKLHRIYDEFIFYFKIVWYKYVIPELLVFWSHIWCNLCTVLLFNLRHFFLYTHASFFPPWQFYWILLQYSNSFLVNIKIIIRTYSTTRCGCYWYVAS